MEKQWNLKLQEVGGLGWVAAVVCMYYNNLGKFARQLNLILCSIDNMRLYLYDGM